MELLAYALGARHRLSTVYAPWAIWTVEEVCKEVLRVLHSLSADLRVSETECNSLLPAI